MGDEWYVTRDGKERHGPYAWAKLKELADFGRLLPSDMVMKAGERQWAPAEKSEGLFRPLPVAVAIPAPAPVPQAEPPREQPQYAPAPYSQPREGTCLSSLLFLLGFLLLLGGGLGVYFLWGMDTSVATDSTMFGGGRVMNLGLMQEQHNGIVVCLGVAIIGVLLMLTSAVLKRSEK